MVLNSQTYKGKNKERIRRKIIEKIREYDIKKILTLESPNFLFSQLLPDKKIIVFENNGDIIKKMEKRCPKNVELVFGNVTKAEVLGIKADFVYLDFCKTWATEEINVIKLRNVLGESKLFAITICIRCHIGKRKKPQKQEDLFEGDPQCHLISQIQKLTGINWEVLYGESYCDSVQMFTLLLKNPNEKDK